MDFGGTHARLALAAMLVLLLAPGPAPAGAAPSQCGAIESDIQIGTGALLTDLSELEGLNHQRFDIPPCSDGDIQNLAVQNAPASALQWAKDCDQNQVVFYAMEGTLNIVFAFEWTYVENKTCGAPAVPQPAGPAQALPAGLDPVAALPPIGRL